MEERELVREWIENIEKEIETQNEEITKIAERVRDEERMRIAERVGIDSEIAESLKAIVSNMDRLEQLIKKVNMRVDRIGAVAYPYI